MRDQYVFFVAQKFKNFGWYQKWDAGIFFFQKIIFLDFARPIFLYSSRKTLRDQYVSSRKTLRDQPYFRRAKWYDFKNRNNSSTIFSISFSTLTSPLSFPLPKSHPFSHTHSSHLISHFSLHYLSLSLTLSSIFSLSLTLSSLYHYLI